MCFGSTAFKGCLFALMIAAPLAAETAQDVAKVLSERAKARADRNRCLAKSYDQYAKDLSAAKDFPALGKVISQHLTTYVSEHESMAKLQNPADAFSKVKTAEDFAKALQAKYESLAAGDNLKAKGYKELAGDLKKVAKLTSSPP